jgi:hypothetical protein
MMNETTMTSGLQERMADFQPELVTKRTYYVGDLCYVMNTDEWFTLCCKDDFYSGMGDDFDPQGFLDPENTSFEDNFAGRPFYLLKTAFGDGCYRGSDGKEYCVDSGTIGAIAVDDISEKEKLADAIERGLGHLHEFEDEDMYMTGYVTEEDNVLYFAGGQLEIAT